MRAIGNMVVDGSLKRGQSAGTILAVRGMTLLLFKLIMINRIINFINNNKFLKCDILRNI